MPNVRIDRTVWQSLFISASVALLSLSCGACGTSNPPTPQAPKGLTASKTSASPHCRYSEPAIDIPKFQGTPKVVSSGGYTPLHRAAEQGRNDTIKSLIDNGADIDAHDNGATPLYYAALNRNYESVQLLIDKGAQINVQSSGNTPLHVADARTAKLLLKHGARIDIVNGAGQTPLAWQAHTGTRETVDLLIQHGAVPDFCTAISAGLVDHLKAYLKEHPDWATYLDEIKEGERQLAGWTPLHQAAWLGQPKSVEILIEHGADVNALVRWSGTKRTSPLSLARHYGKPVETAKVLLEHGANPNATTYCRAADVQQTIIQEIERHPSRKSDVDDALVKLLKNYGAQ